MRVTNDLGNEKIGYQMGRREYGGNVFRYLRMDLSAVGFMKSVALVV